MKHLWRATCRSLCLYLIHLIFVSKQLVENFVLQQFLDCKSLELHCSFLWNDCYMNVAILRHRKTGRCNLRGRLTFLQGVQATIYWFAASMSTCTRTLPQSSSLTRFPQQSRLEGPVELPNAPSAHIWSRNHTPSAMEVSELVAPYSIHHSSC